jgi:hypothetical protein
VGPLCGAGQSSSICNHVKSSPSQPADFRGWSFDYVLQTQLNARSPPSITRTNPITAQAPPSPFPLLCHQLLFCTTSSALSFSNSSPSFFFPSEPLFLSSPAQLHRQTYTRGLTKLGTKEPRPRKHEDSCPTSSGAPKPRLLTSAKAQLVTLHCVHTLPSDVWARTGVSVRVLPVARTRNNHCPSLPGHNPRLQLLL